MLRNLVSCMIPKAGISQKAFTPSEKRAHNFPCDDGSSHFLFQVFLIQRKLFFIDNFLKFSGIFRGPNARRHMADHVQHHGGVQQRRAVLRSNRHEKSLNFEAALMQS